MTFSRHRIDSIKDIAALSEDQFSRMLPDLIEWHSIVRKLSDVVSVTGFTWIDDGKPKVVHSFNLTDSDGVHVLKGPGWTER